MKRRQQVVREADETDTKTIESRRVTPMGIGLLVWILLGAWGLYAIIPPRSTAQGAVEAGVVVGHGERESFPIAVPQFAVKGNRKLDQALFSKVITNDLNLSGFFRPPDKPVFALETHRLDQARGVIHYAEWYRIGVFYLVKGEYKIDDNQLAVEVKTYDTVSQRYIFGNRYLNYTVRDARLLAHRISNDIIQRVTSHPGVADTQILFIQQRDPLGKGKQVCVMDADGFNLRPLTGEGDLTATPCWGARGTEIYYTTWRDFNPDLEGLILRKGKRWWISRRGGFNLSPAWSETNKLIALTLTKDGNSEIYTIDREGRSPRRLTHNQAIDQAPDWSRDGKKLVFTSDRGGAKQIYLLDVAGGQLKRLTYRGRYNDGAAWSPAGPERIAFASQTDGYFHIFSMNPDGSDLRQLTRGSHNNEAPSWAPNGMLLTFFSDRSGRDQIYSMFAADGSNVQPLTRGKPCHSPAWSPAAR